MTGLRRAESFPTNSFNFVSAALLSSNSRTASSSRQKARMTRTPVRFSLVRPVTVSRHPCTLPKSGMLRYMMTNTTRKSTGMATVKIRAQRVLIVNAMTMEPSTIKGLRRRRRSPMFTPFCTWLISSVRRVISVSVPRVSSSV